MGVRLTTGRYGNTPTNAYLSNAEREKLPYTMSGKKALFGPHGDAEVSIGIRRSDLRRGREPEPHIVVLEGRRQRAIPLGAVFAAIRQGLIPRDAMQRLVDSMPSGSMWEEEDG